MKYFILIGLYIFCSFGMYSQHLTITGAVKDATDTQCVEFATISITNMDSLIINSCFAKEDGTFLLEKMNDGEYILCASFIGYKPHYRTIKLTESENIGDILLTKDEMMLNEVVVEGKRPFVQQKIDRYIVNISDHLLTAGKNGMDVLKYTPGLLVQNKNVTIMGDQVDVWIDGRPSRMDSETLATYLEGLQAENIDQIEVITNPSSSFDAGGGRGIINIKMKKSPNMDLLNGSLNLGYEQSKRHIGVGGVGLNYRSGKLNVYGSYNIRGGDDTSTMQELTKNSTPTESREYDKKIVFDVDKTISHNYRVGADFFLDKSNIFGVLFNGFNNNQTINTDGKTGINPPEDNTTVSLMRGDYKTDVRGQMYNVNYKHLFEKEGVELNVDADYGYIPRDQGQTQHYTFFNSSETESQPASSERNTLRQTINLWSAKIDYKHPISKLMYWDTGIKAGGTKTDNDLIYEHMAADSWQNDIDRSNHFNYNENIYAAYANWNQTIGKWAYQAGVRAEYTYLKGNQLTMNEINEQKYFKVFPTLYIQYTENDNNSFVLSYSRRIRRPNYDALNPFKLALDNYSYIAGNPDLNPSYVNNVELKYTLYQKLTTTLNWMQNNDMMLLKPFADDANNSYGHVYDNFGRRTAYICMVNYNDNYFKFWRLNFMAQLAYIENKSSDASADFNNDGLSAAIWIGNNWQITKSLSIEASLLLLPSMRVGYMKSDKLENSFSLGIRKNLLSDKATVSLTANDILNGQVTRNIMDFNNIHIYNINNNNSRSITLNFSYRFGSNKIKGSRERDIGIESELERSQSSK